MELTEILFQYELKTNKYGKLFFRIYPDDEKEEHLLKFADKDKDEKTIFTELFFKLYNRASNNSVLPENIDTSLLTALRLFNGDYQNQNFDVSLVTGNNKNNPDYRDNVPGFYFDNEGFLMEKTTNYINYHAANSGWFMFEQRRSGSQGCPITYPSQYWQVLPDTKTNRSVDGYFYINRTLYDYY